jgi:site-specific DNA-methyltransferase (adenine-specific)
MALWNGIELPESYFNDDDVYIVKGDSAEALLHIPATSIDLVLTDPPYGITPCGWDVVPNLTRLWNALKELGKPSCAYVFTTSQPFTTDLINSNRGWFKYEWVWRKNQGSNFASSKYMPIRYHENVLVFYSSQPLYNPPRVPRWSNQSRQRMKTPVGKGKQKRNFGTMANTGNVQYDSETKTPESVLEIKCVPNGGGHRVHQTQKPVELMQYLVETYTEKNNIVIDPFLGSGTTAIASAKTGRKCIGIEISEEYCELSAIRYLRSLNETGGSR